PTFKNLFASLHGTLPLPTRILLAASHYSIKFAPFIIVTDVVLVLAFRRWLQTDTGRAHWDTLKLRVPIFGKLVHKTAMTRLCRTLATPLRSGVPILEALEITTETVGNTVVARAVKDVQSAVKEGESIAEPLGGHTVFPPMVTQMLAVGEETGMVDVMLE